jgi:hypothetical protein
MRRSGFRCLTAVLSGTSSRLDRLRRKRHCRAHGSRQRQRCCQQQDHTNAVGERISHDGFGQPSILALSSHIGGEISARLRDGARDLGRQSAVAEPMVERAIIGGKRDRADDRHGEQVRERRHGVVDSRRHAGLARRDGVDDRGGQRRDGDGHAETEHDHRQEERRPIRASRSGQCQ